MTKVQRLLEVVKAMLAAGGFLPEDCLACVDCLSGLPKLCVPKMGSLRDFARNVLGYFLGFHPQCELNYPRAARYIARWKETWGGGTAGAPAGPTRLHWALALDARMTVLYWLNTRGPSACPATHEDLLTHLGLTGQPGGVCWLLDAMMGETVTVRSACGGQAWVSVIGPTYIDGEVVALHGTSVQVVRQPQGVAAD